jgi:hypothetical protein
VYELVDTCGVYECDINVLSIVACDIVIYIYIYVCVCVFVNVESKKNKTKCGLFAERGCRQRGLCRGHLAITLGNSGKNLHSSGVPSFDERSCTGPSVKKFFKK